MKRKIKFNEVKTCTCHKMKRKTAMLKKTLSCLKVLVVSGNIKPWIITEKLYTFYVYKKNITL